MKTVMILAGEASGDLHGANLVAALRRLSAEPVTFCGMGGTALRAQGVEILVDAARMAVVGLFEVLAHLGDILAARATLLDRLRTKPDLLILIDYPDFNLHLAAHARRLGVPVLYYISPQVWAWRPGRVRTIAQRVDRMAVILPFEKDFYAQRGFAVDFVGHPLLDSVPAPVPRAEFLARHGLPTDRPVVGILPGSRISEVGRILPIFLDAAGGIEASRGPVLFLVPLAPSLERACLESFLAARPDLDVRIIEGGRYDLMAACDVALAASGTVTLELAILNVPMVVGYRVSGLTYRLGRRFITVDHASLVNLIAGRAVVPELLQEHCVAEELSRAVLDLWPGTAAVVRMREELRGVVERLGAGGASTRAAGIALEILQGT